MSTDTDTAPSADDLVREQFAIWLRSKLSGCSFAAWATTKDRIASAAFFEPPTDALVDRLTAHVDVARRARQLALALFPQIVDEAGVRRLLHALRRSDRWSVRTVDVPARTGFDVRWRHALGSRVESSAIGFAPLGTMPVTRRAPYVALGIWPRGHDNPRRRKPDPFVGVGDMAHDIDGPAYDRLFAETRRRVGQFRDVLGEKGVVTGVTFFLSPDRRRARSTRPR